MSRTIQPLGEGIIIRAIPPADSIKGIIIPDTAKGITLMGSRGAEDAVHFVEAEVIAVGPGRHAHDADLIPELVQALRQGKKQGPALDALIARAENPPERIPLSVKPGDRIVYHPSVSRFDRKVEGLGEGDFYIILENSVLAVIE